MTIIAYLGLPSSLVFKLFIISSLLTNILANVNLSLKMRDHNRVPQVNHLFEACGKYLIQELCKFLFHCPRSIALVAVWVDMVPIVVTSDETWARWGMWEAWNKVSTAYIYISYIYVHIYIHTHICIPVYIYICMCVYYIYTYI